MDSALVSWHGHCSNVDAALCAFECVTESLRIAALINATMTDLIGDGRHRDALSQRAQTVERQSEGARIGANGPRGA